MTHRVPRTHTITQTLDPLARLVFGTKKKCTGENDLTTFKKGQLQNFEARELLCTCDPGAFEVGLLCDQHVTVVK